MRLLMLVLLLSVSACIPLGAPTDLYNPDSRRSVGEKDVPDISPGKTTRQQVLLRFGQPDRNINDEQKFVYHWSKTKFRTIIITYGDVGIVDFDRFYAFEIVFDDKGLVQTAELFDRSKLLDPNF